MDRPQRDCCPPPVRQCENFLQCKALPRGRFLSERVIQRAGFIAGAQRARF
ncbi:hypothetical protein BRPE64_ACDS16970 [Caballeronia insecticola]|uniref:Uncharacterized protein n=1 Tax=Caballeronia insecticola TaxID=758793 RepID=R4WWX0_9BURK|nr:hypothetical protein BRPE64_ACDS16970 [Caballeronia insecticola]